MTARPIVPRNAKLTNAIKAAKARPFLFKPPLNVRPHAFRNNGKRKVKITLAERA